MSVSNPNKTVNTPVIGCSDKAQVTLSFDALSELKTKPMDLILVLDRSGSMSGERLKITKEGAKNLVDKVITASGGVAGQTTGTGSRIGLISFSTSATADVPLGNDAAAVTAGIDAISAGGQTNHVGAFSAAKKMIDVNSLNAQKIIVFTDGITTLGPDPVGIADEIKAMGAEIFCMGLSNLTSLLESWASSPAATHVATSDNNADILKLFDVIADEVVEAGAYDVSIREELNPDFKIVNAPVPAAGSVSVINPQTFEWKIPAAGVLGAETVEYTFEIMHKGSSGGVKKVNKTIDYTDRAGNALTFPDPEITVNCSDSVIVPEGCPEPTAVAAEGCQDAVIVDLKDISVSSIGRVLQLNVKIKNVCPGKRLGLAVLVTEKDEAGAEYARGLKTLLIPALSGDVCEDVLVKCIQFVVPEALDKTGSPTALCNSRSFNARAFVNYIDTDFICCDPETVILRD